MDIRAIAERADAATIEFRQPLRPQQLRRGAGRISAIAVQHQYSVAAPGKRQIVQHEGGRRAIGASWKSRNSSMSSVPSL